MERAYHDEGIAMITHTGILHRTLFPSLVWCMPGEKIYLTFDDGPHSTATESVLETLKRHRVPATFFLSGANIPGREAIVRKIEADGHSIGIHAFNHSRISALSVQKTTEEIKNTEALLMPIVAQRLRLFRPPFGFFSHNTIRAAKERGYLMVMWSCLPGDFSSASVETVVQRSLERLHKGAILVFHDNDLTAGKIAGILDAVIPKIKERGFRFGAIR
jgi:peptidoglycan/xylan/chitin deacetylase (PgdA/CDA1 family)